MKLRFEQGTTKGDAFFEKNGREIVVRRGRRTTTFSYQATPTGYRLLSNDVVYDVAPSRVDEEGGEIVVNGTSIRLRWQNPRMYSASQNAGKGPGAGEVRAVMPGRVVRIRIKEGERVTAGDPLLVLEAMKMENEIKAPIGGTVTSVAVADGASVDTHALLVTLTPEETTGG